MIYVYAILSLFCFFVVFRPGRIFDFVSLGFFSQQIYFSPLLFQAFGYCGVFGCYDYRVAVVGIWIALSLTIFSLFAMHSNAHSKAKGAALVNMSHLSGALFYMRIGFAVLSFIGLVYLVYSSAGSIFFADKASMLEYISYDYVVWVGASTLGLLVAVVLGSKVWISYFLLMFFLNIYIGFRSPSAIAMFSVFMLYSNKYSLSMSRIGTSRFFFIVLVGLAFFVYKGFYAAIKLGDYELLFSRVLDVDYYFFVFQNSEPVLTLSILSNVLSDGLYIGPADLLRILPVFFLFMDGLFSDLAGFNSVIQPLYYSYVSGGVGSNVWAHVFSMLGWLGLFVFIVLYSLSLYLLSRYFMKAGVYVKVLLAYAGSSWAFYIHRNDLVYQLTLEKRIVLLFFVVYFIAYFVNRAVRARAS